MTAQQLRDSILQMAVQGKLVPQDPKDEPVSVLLKCIRAERQILIKEGKIKQDKNESVISRRDNSYYAIRDGMEVCIDEELPFEIPESWALVRLDDIGVYRKGPFGSSLTKSIFVPKSENSVKVYEQKNAIQRDASLGTYYITKQYFESKMRGFEVFPGDIIVSCAGTIGETYVLPENIEQGIINQALMRMKISSVINIDYFLIYFDYVLKRSAQGSSKGSAIKNIPPFEIFKKLILPLPPIQEQARIVEKIEALLPHINDYDVVHQKLTALNADFPDALKKSILQHAVQGKLVPQDPKDETSSALLNRIRAEKQRLIKDGKIKKDKSESFIVKRDGSYYEIHDRAEVCIDDELPFDIPESWEWVRLGSIGNWGSGATPDKGIPAYFENGTIPWLLTGDLNDGHIDYIPGRITKLALAKTSVRLNPVGSVLIAMYGATIGKVGILDIEATTNQACCACSPIEGVYNEYLFYYLMSQRTAFQKRGEGGAQPNISKEKVVATLFPLPPLAEQHRIVVKIKELLPHICKL